MNKKDIVFAAINHKPSKGLPFDIFEGWMWPEPTERLLRRFDASGYDNLLDKMGVYCRWVTAKYIGPSLPQGAKDRVASPHTTHSLNASIWGLRPGLKMHGLGTGGHPLSSAQSKEDVFNYAFWPSDDLFDYQGLKHSATKYENSFVVVGGFSPIFYLIADLCGMQKALMDLIENPELIHALVEKIVEFYESYFSQICKAGHGNIDAIAFGDDFAGQESMLMSPDHWRKYFKPAWLKLFNIAKRNGYIVMFHTCGSVYEIIPDLIDIGLDILYPIQPLARSMDLELLKKQFGSSLTFYGGIDVQNLLPFGSVEEIEGEVIRIAKLFKTGGYILSTSHVIMNDVPEENIITLYDVAKRITD
jgi:uroporphyrinogen decarboxylase